MDGMKKKSLCCGKLRKYRRRRKALASNPWRDSTRFHPHRNVGLSSQPQRNAPHGNQLVILGTLKTVNSIYLIPHFITAIPCPKRTQNITVSMAILCVLPRQATQRTVHLISRVEKAERLLFSSIALVPSGTFFIACTWSRA